jgi:serine/alanine adding enzyme
MAAAISSPNASGSVVEHKDQNKWDELVADLGGQPFQAWAWGALKEQFGWQPIRLSSGDGKSAVQVLVRPYRGLSVAYVPRGPVLGSGGQVDQALLDEVVRVARSRRAAFLRFEPDLLQTEDRAADLDSSLRVQGFRTAERTLGQRSSIRLDLTPTPEELFASFSKGHRADIKRAQRDGVAVRIAESDEDVDWLRRMLTATTERKTFEYHSAGYYRALWRAFGDSVRVLLAEHDGEVVAASMNLAFGRNGLYLFAGSNLAGLNARAGHLLQWHAIQWARERGARTWDLWGIADARGHMEVLRQRGVPEAAPEMQRLEREAKRDPKDGLLRFKKGWGGYVVRSVPAYDRVFIAPAYWLWTRRRGEV